MKVALLIAALTSSATGPVYHGRPCARTYTLSMFDQASDATYRGVGLPPVGAYGRLHRYEGCLRRSADRPGAKVLWTTDRAEWSRRRAPTTVASWYYDAGQTASGYHVGNGVANRSLAFGTRVQICYPAHSSNCTETVVDDRGPYANGADFDLNQNVAGALGFQGVQAVSYTIR